jgi:predicted nucleic acid-binding protein
MKEAIIYLDSSIIIKRYVKEPGSESVRNIFLKTYSGELTLSFSSWNIGEVLGALDRAMVHNRLSKEKHAISKKRFLLETRRLIKLGRLMLIPIRIRILSESWKLIEKYHIYQADALQIASAKNVNASQFLVSDKKLHEIAEMENLNSVYIS